MSSRPTSSDVAALVEVFFRGRAEGRRLSVDEVLSQHGSSGDPQLRATLIADISRLTRNSSHSSPALDGRLEAPGAARLTAVLPEIAGYDLIDEIGRGGMGVVYEAYQQSTGRRVAVKLISDALMANESARWRFEREVELIVRLQHPNIVSVIDSGIYQERCFYVMEYVEGPTLDEHVRISKTSNSQKVKTRELLTLLAAVCDAVEYAHQRGVLHRDLKPSNILIDPRGQPRILDFGLAKDIDSLVGHRQALTMAEPGQLLGTLAYMAPEQARGAHDEVSVRSDVYALGAIGYEALAGRLPCPTEGALHDVLARIQQQDPPHPSSIVRDIPSDVDAILLKALDKSPKYRYATAGDLAADLRHWLADEPVSAHPASALYQFRKFARRNKVLVGGVAAVFFVLTVGAVVSTGLYVRAERLRREAERQRQSAVAAASAESVARHESQQQQSKTEAINKFIQDALNSSDPNQGGEQEIKVADAMMRAVKLLDDGQFKDQPEFEAGLRLTISEILDGNSRSAESLVQAEKALAIYKQSHAGDHPDIAKSLNYVATSKQTLGQTVDAEPLFVEALAMYQRLYKGDHPHVASSLNDLAYARQLLGRPAEAEPLLMQSIAMFQRLFRSDHPDLATSMNSLASVRLSLGRPAEAEPILAQALEMTQRLFKGDHPDVATSLNNLASIQLSLGRAAEAERLYAKAFAMYERLFRGDHPHVATALNNLAYCKIALGKASEALSSAQAGWEMRRRILPAHHVDICCSEVCVGAALIVLKRFADAEPLLLEAQLFLDRRPTLWYGRCLESLVRLYSGWHTAEPGKGYDAKAAEWRDKFKAWRGTT